MKGTEIWCVFLLKSGLSWGNIFRDVIFRNELHLWGCSLDLSLSSFLSGPCVSLSSPAQAVVYITGLRTLKNTSRCVNEVCQQDSTTTHRKTERERPRPVMCSNVCVYTTLNMRTWTYTFSVCHQAIICAWRCVERSTGGPLQGVCVAAVHHLMN